VPRRLRALDFREPAPEYEFADGTIVQTRYLDAAGWTLYEVYLAKPTDADALIALVQAVAPTLTREYLDERVTLADMTALIQIGKGNAELILAQRKNGPGGATSNLDAASPIPPSNMTMISPPSSVALPAPTAAAP
jgi:hypothetical protein